MDHQRYQVHYCLGCDVLAEKTSEEAAVCPRCGARVIFGSGRHRREIHVQGHNHNEVSQVTREVIRQAERPVLLNLMTHWSFWSGLLASALGVGLVILGSTGTTEFTFFGQSFKSQNVGIAALFIGASVVVLNVRRILKAYEKTHSATSK